MDNNKIIEVRKLTKIFPGTIALDKVDFDLNKAEVHAVVGENGAGKSTLIKILSGVYHKTTGAIYFDGVEKNIINTKEALDLGISVIYQELENLPKLSVAENIFLGELPKIERLHCFVNSNKLLQITKDLLNRLNIDINPKEMVGNLSIAHQQLVEIAKSLSHEVKVLIMDEPTSYFSEDETKKLFKTIADVKRHGVSVIYVSHRLQEILDIADRITVLRDGKSVVTIEDIKDINEYEIIKFIIGEKSHKILQQEKRKLERKKVIFEVKNLNIYKRLKDFNMKLYEGEILGIVGLVGSGKDELIQSIVGLWPRISGDFLIDNKKIKITTPKDAIDKGIVYLSYDRKNLSIFPNLKCRENISPIWLHKVYRKIFILKSREIDLSKLYIKKLSIKTSSTEEKIKDLSGGNQQKLIFARLLAIKPRILLLHDPTRGIDIGSKNEIYKIINELANKGTSIIFLSSELQEICNLANRILVIFKGCLREEFTDSDIKIENIFASVTISRLEKNG